MQLPNRALLGQGGFSSLVGGKYLLFPFSLRPRRLESLRYSIDCRLICAMGENRLTGFRYRFPAPRRLRLYGDGLPPAPGNLL